MMDDSEIKSSAEVCVVHGNELQKAALKGGKAWCRECREEGIALRDREDKERAARELFEYRTRRLRSISSLPERFTGCTFENYEAKSAGQRMALSLCRDFAQSVIGGEDNSLILSGAVGTGKTHLGCAIANAVMSRIVERQRFDVGDVLYLTVPELLHEVRAAWANPRTNEVEVFNKYGQCFLLVLDEAGVQRGSEDEQRILFNVINRRYENRLPTVVISNLAVSNLDRVMGERVIDRLRQNGKAVTFDWGSYRKHACLGGLAA